MTHVAKVEYDALNDEHFLVIPAELLVVLGWKEGDDLEWLIEDDTAQPPMVVLRRVS